MILMRDPRGRPPVVAYPSSTQRVQLKTEVPVELKVALVERSERSGRTIGAVMESMLRRELLGPTAA
jgi:hypothetical protein